MAQLRIEDVLWENLTGIRVLEKLELR